MKSFNSLPEEKREKYLKIIFNRGEFKRATQPYQTNILDQKTSKEASTGVYQCPRCGNEDRTLASWKKIQSSKEKWDQHLIEWYQKKKFERKLAAEKSKVAKTPRTELFSKSKSSNSFRGQDILSGLEKSPQSQSKLPIPGMELISPNAQKMVLQLEELKSYSQGIQEKIDAVKNREEELEKSFLTSTRFSDAENLDESGLGDAQDLDQSELRDVHNRDDSLLEGISMTPTDIYKSKEEDDAPIASWRTDTDEFQKSPGSEASPGEKSGFTHLITSSEMHGEPDMTSRSSPLAMELCSTIEEPEIQSNLLLPASDKWQRTYYLSTITEESGDSRNNSREILQKAASSDRAPETSTSKQSGESLPVFSPPQQEPEILISNEKRKSPPVFSKSKMSRRSTMFRLPPKSPSSDEPGEVDATTVPETPEVNTDDIVEEPPQEPPQDPTEDEPHMTVPNANGGAVQVCQLVDEANSRHQWHSHE